MSTLIFRTIAPVITVLMITFSVFVMLRGHNEPGGGFIGGLIAASAIAIYGIASGPDTVRRALKADPLAYAGFGAELCMVYAVLIEDMLGTAGFFLAAGVLLALLAFVIIRVERRMKMPDATEGATA